MEAVCYTREGTLEKAIDQEQKSFEIYRQIIKIVKNPSARKSSSRSWPLRNWNINMPWKRP